MRRREFMAALGAMAAWPLTGRAQAPGMPTVGYLGAESPARFATRLRAFRQGLGEAGYRETVDVHIEYRWAEGHNERLPALAADLVQRNVTMIAAPGSVASALAAKAATSTIPIVFEIGADPVEVGLVASLNRPNGNVTGVTSLNAEVTPKRLALLRELVPKATRFGVLVNPSNPKNAEATIRDIEAAAHKLGVETDILKAASESDLNDVFATVVRLQSPLCIANETFFANRSELLAGLTMRNRVPAAHQSREFAAAGGLLGYGGSIAQSHRQAGIYAGRILHGARPAELPVQRVTKVEMFINVTTAKALGLAVPVSLLSVADEVFE